MNINLSIKEKQCLVLIWESCIVLDKRLNSKTVKSLSKKKLITSFTSYDELCWMLTNLGYDIIEKIDINQYSRRNIKDIEL